MISIRDEKPNNSRNLGFKEACLATNESKIQTNN